MFLYKTAALPARLAFFGAFGYYVPTMAFAVIHTGGKQYKVAAGDSIKVEKLADKAPGDQVVFDKVLLVDDGTTTTVGAPYINGVSVKATYEAHGRNATVEVIKYKQKSRYFKKNGHRQPWSKVKIDSIK